MEGLCIWLQRHKLSSRLERAARNVSLRSDVDFSYGSPLRATPTFNPNPSPHPLFSILVRYILLTLISLPSSSRVTLNCKLEHCTAHVPPTWAYTRGMEIHRYDHMLSSFPSLISKVNLKFYGLID